MYEHADDFAGNTELEVTVSSVQDGTTMLTRRGILAAIGIGVVTGVALVGGAAVDVYHELQDSATAQSGEQEAAAEKLLQQAGASLLAMHQESNGGWRFRSEIQAPHFQTDRDVGAASVGMGFLALAERYPHDSRWLDAAERTAVWLTAVSKQDADGGRYWPDYADDGDVSDSHYTSFDDGAIGIGDFYWRLYEKTHNDQYKTIALQSVQWTFAQAQNIGNEDRPVYRWQWDANDNTSPYYTGMGEGAAGIIDTLATYYQRTKSSDPAFAAQCKQYIDGGLRWLDQVRGELGKNGGDARAIPETGVVGQDGDTAMNAGYLSGVSGIAFMYLHLVQVFGDQRYTHQAGQSLNWLNDTSNGPKVEFGHDAAAWKLMLDPAQGDNTHYATGFEEGNAGIGWAYLQAYRLTGQERYLTTAKQSANRLLQVARTDNGGLSWPEDENPASSIVHANLNNGAAGIGMYLLDMYEATKNIDPTAAKRYLAGARGAQKWLIATTVHDGHKAYWRDFGRGDNSMAYVKDPSWHWGSAGIIAFLARMSGGSFDVPGEQPALVGR